MEVNIALFRYPKLCLNCLIQIALLLNIITNCYGPSVSSITVTKRGPLGSSGLYKTSGIMGREVAKLYNQFST